MIAVGYAWWRTARPGSRERRRGALLWGILVLAAFLSGARGAFVFVPLLLALIALLDRGSIRQMSRMSWAMAGAGIALAFTFVIVGLGPISLIGHLWHVAATEFDIYVVSGFREALSHPLGLGAGVDTSGARYVADAPELRQEFGGLWQESWWVKAVLELGIPGLVVSLILFGAILHRVLRRHFLLADAQLRTISAALGALLLWALIYNFKAQYIDLDPLNVYFWLFAGILLRLYEIDRSERRASPEASGSDAAPSTAHLGRSGASAVAPDQLPLRNPRSSTSGGSRS